MTWKVIIAAIGLAFLFEGVIYFALPDVSRKLIRQILESGSGLARRIGIVSIAVGLVLLWIASTI